MQIQVKSQSSQASRITNMRLGEFLMIEDKGVDQLMEKPSNVDRLTFGLDNLGNTCFYNSVMQCLTHTVPLLNFCLSQGHQKFCEKRKNEVCLMCRYCSFISNIVNNNKANPREVVNFLSLHWKTYKKGRQEDAHEFLVILIENFLNSCFKMKQVNKLKFEQDTPIYKIFGGKLRSQVHCQGCYFKSNRLEDSLSISLDIPQKYQGKMNLDACFRSFIQVETLDGQNKYLCSNCNRRCVAKKRFTIHQTPRILIVHLKRFNNFGKKLSQFVEYPSTIRLHQYTSEFIDSQPKNTQQKTFTQNNNQHFNQNRSFQDQNQSQKDIYDLYGLVIHYGNTPKMGHYISFVKTLDNQWIKCDDDQLTRVHNGEQGILKQQPYILFYQKRKIIEKQESKQKIIETVKVQIQQEEKQEIQPQLPKLQNKANSNDTSTAADSKNISSDDEKQAAILQQQKVQPNIQSKSNKDINISKQNMNIINKDDQAQEQNLIVKSGLLVKSQKNLKEESIIISEPQKPNSKILQDLLNKVLSSQENQIKNDDKKKEDIKMTQKQNLNEKNILNTKEQIQIQEIKQIKKLTKAKSKADLKDQSSKQSNIQKGEIGMYQSKKSKSQERNQNSIIFNLNQKATQQQIKPKLKTKTRYNISMKDLHPKVINYQTKKRKRDAISSIQQLATTADLPLEPEPKKLKKNDYK